MYRIRRFGVIRTATVVAVAYAIAFAFVAIPLALIGLSAPRGAFAAAALVPALLFVLLVVYPIVIWVFTAIACLVYNLAARFVGGIEVQVERPPQAWAPPPPAGWAGQPPGGWQQPQQAGWGGPQPGTGTPPERQPIDQRPPG